MGQAHWHTFQILTKRHERLAELAPSLPWHPNVWIGVSIEVANHPMRGLWCSAQSIRRVPVGGVTYGL